MYNQIRWSRSHNQRIPRWRDSNYGSMDTRHDTISKRVFVRDSLIHQQSDRKKWHRGSFTHSSKRLLHTQHKCVGLFKLRGLQRRNGTRSWMGFKHPLRWSLAPPSNGSLSQLRNQKCRIRVTLILLVLYGVQLIHKPFTTTMLFRRGWNQLQTPMITYNHSFTQVNNTSNGVTEFTVSGDNV